MASDTGMVKDERLVTKSAKLLVEARGLFEFIENHLTHPDTKPTEGGLKPQLSKPIDEINANIQDTICDLERIKQVFIKEFVDRL